MENHTTREKSILTAYDTMGQVTYRLHQLFQKSVCAHCVVPYLVLPRKYPPNRTCFVEFRFCFEGKPRDCIFFVNTRHAECPYRI